MIWRHTNSNSSRKKKKKNTGKGQKHMKYLNTSTLVSRIEAFLPFLCSKLLMVSYPAALFDPVAEPPVAEGCAAHIENKEGQDEEEDGPPS